MLRIFALVAAGLIVGCKSTPKETVLPPQTPSTDRLESIIEHTRDSVAQIKEVSGEIVEDGNTVMTTVESVLPSVPEEAKSPLSKATDIVQGMQHKAEVIQDNADRIEKETQTLANLSEQVRRLEKKIIELESAAAQAQAQALQRLFGYITVFWVIGFILIVAGAAVAFFLNKGYGASLGLIGLLMIGFASASQYYMQEIALIGAVILVVGFLTAIGMIVWSTILSKRNSTAVAEVVEMIEVFKEGITDAEKERLFGEKGIASRVQSEITREIVAKIREKNGFKILHQVRTEADNAKSSPSDG